MRFHHHIRGVSMMEVLVATLLLTTALAALLIQQSKTWLQSLENHTASTIHSAADNLLHAMMISGKTTNENNAGIITQVQRYPDFLQTAQIIQGQNRTSFSLPSLPPPQSTQWAKHHLDIFRQQLQTLPASQHIGFIICMDRPQSLDAQWQEGHFNPNCRPLSRNAAARNITVLKIVWQHGTLTLPLPQ